MTRHWLEWLTIYSNYWVTNTIYNTPTRNGTSRRGVCSSCIGVGCCWYRLQPLGVLLEDGHAICPDCQTHVNCGTVGIANLEQRHWGKKICRETQERWDKEAKKKKDGSLLTFFGKRPNTTPIPSNFWPSTPVRGHDFSASASPAILDLSVTSPSVTDHSLSPPLSRLHTTYLPFSVILHHRHVIMTIHTLHSTWIRRLSNISRLLLLSILSHPYPSESLPVV